MKRITIDAGNILALGIQINDNKISFVNIEDNKSFRSKALKGVIWLKEPSEEAKKSNRYSQMLYRETQEIHLYDK